MSANNKKMEAALAKINLEAGRGDDDDDDDDDDEEYMLENLASKAIVKRVTGLKKIQEDVLSVVEEYKKERIALEKKYEALKAPHYAKRDQVISGTLDFDDTVFEGNEEAKQAYDEAVDDPEPPVVGLPGFWGQALSYHPASRTYISEEDQEVLEHLTDIRCEVNDDYTGFKMVFTFSDNDFFSDKELEKNYVVDPDILDETGTSLESATGTVINWKPGKNLCEEEIQKKQKAKSGKRKGEFRTITKKVMKESFFHFFSDPKEPDDGEDEEEKKDDEADFRLDYDEDYEIAHAIRTSLLPEAVLWYTGENVDDDDDYDEEDGEDGEEDDDDDDDEDAPKLIGDPKKGFSMAGKPKAGSAKKGGPTGPGGENPPECKQN